MYLARKHSSVSSCFLVDDVGVDLVHLVLPGIVDFVDLRILQTSEISDILCLSQSLVWILLFFGRDIYVSV